MPKGFAAIPVDVWLPAQLSPFLMRQRDARFLSGVARMKPGVSVQQAHADLGSPQGSLGEQYPATDGPWSLSLRALKPRPLGDSGKPLLLLFGAVALLLS